MKTKKTFMGFLKSITLEKLEVVWSKLKPLTEKIKAKKWLILLAAAAAVVVTLLLQYFFEFDITGFLGLKLF